MTDYTELGKRIVACKGFRWLPGMLCQRRMHTGEWVPVRLTDHTTVVDYRVVERNAVPSMNQAAARIMGEGYITLNGWVLADDLLPDLSDAATKGCVLQLVREAWGIMIAPYHYHPPTTTAAALWAVCRHTYGHMPRELWCLGAPTEEALLTLIMEALPCPEP